MEYRGTCHCGALRVIFRTGLDPSEWAVRACQCSFCLSHGAATTSDPSGELEFRATDRASVQQYRFGTRTADMLLCRRCGILVGAQMRTDATRLGVVNVQVLRPRPAGLAMSVPAEFEGENLEERLSRRAARWTPVSEGSV